MKPRFLHPIAPLVLTALGFAAGSTPGEDDRRPLPAVPPPQLGLERTAYEEAEKVRLPETPPEEGPGLHNVFRLSADMVSGSEPHGEEAFQRLQRMGIKTILSVDGKVPDAVLAARYGMRYVHVPIQYKGITAEEMEKIAKTYRELDGPFYTHCFHGEHRGPAAAAVGRIVRDGVSREQAIAEMRQWCGTSPKYEGLYRDILSGDIPEAGETLALEWDFPAAHAFTGFRDAMIHVSRAADNLKYLSKRGWVPDEKHPDVDALNEAVMLLAALEQANALDEIAGKKDDFRGWMGDSVEHARSLREALAGLRARPEGEPAADALRKRVDETYRSLAKACASCHEVYRDE